MNMIYLGDRATKLNTDWVDLCGPKLVRILIDNNIGSVWDIVACTRYDIRIMPGIGSSYLSQIEENLEALGLSLRRAA